jgi:phosphate transport system substrate-binding protein
MRKLAPVAVSAIAALIVPLSVSAQAMVEWVTPAAPANHPQTEAEAAAGRASGRKLPTPEILQPTLDASLQPYRPSSGGKLTGKFKAASSDVLPGLAGMWIAAFRKYHPGVEIEVSLPYAGSLGAQELVKGNLDLVFVSRELRPEDITGFRAKFNYDPLSVPICGGTYRHFGFLDAIGFFVNKDNPIEKLTFQQLDGILSATRHRGGAALTKWGDLGLAGDWADKPIHVYGVQPWNGFEEFVRQRVLSLPGRRGEWRDGIQFEKVVFPLAGRVAADRYGIGYSGLAYLDAAVKLLALAPEGGGDTYAPTYENVAAATYPLSRLVFLNLNRAPGKPLNPALQEFLRFILSREGQRIVLDQAVYLPLREWQAARSRALLE